LSRYRRLHRSEGCPVEKEHALAEKPDGSLDKSFGSGGKIILPDLVQDLVVGPDGKIVVLYYHFAPRHVHLARFNVNGKPDHTFGRSGDINLRLHSKFYYPQLTGIMNALAVGLHSEDLREGVVSVGVVEGRGITGFHNARGQELAGFEMLD
jgi:hypothetical protein